RSTPLTATKPLNSFVSPRVWRMISSAMPARCAAAVPFLSVSGDYPERAGAWQWKGKAVPGASTEPLRRALFDERVDALLGVGFKRAAGHNLAGKVVRGPEAEIDLPVERLLALCDDARAARADEAGEVSDRRIELGSRHDTIDQPPGQRGRGVD